MYKLSLDSGKYELIVFKFNNTNKPFVKMALIFILSKTNCIFGYELDERLCTILKDVFPVQLRLYFL